MKMLLDTNTCLRYLLEDKQEQTDRQTDRQTARLLPGHNEKKTTKKPTSNSGSVFPCGGGYVVKRTVSLFLLFTWTASLFQTDSYYVVYLFLGFIGIICWTLEATGKISVVMEPIDYVISGLGSVAITAANYRIYSALQFPIAHVTTLYKIAVIVVAVCGGIVCFAYILSAVKGLATNFWWKQNNIKQRPELVFCVALLLIIAVYAAVFILGYYPGILTTDSIDQITQSMAGMYTNHHPFYHTLVIKFFLMVGISLFNDMNMAVALYSVFQIIFMAVSFSYAIMTLYQLGISTKVIVVTTLIYTGMPYHIYYSFTMWKDIMFGGFVLLFIVSVFRYMMGLSKHKVIWVGIAFSALGICLFRSNGWFAFVVTTITFLFMFRRQHKQLGFLFVGIIILGYVLNNPVLDKLGVAPTDVGAYLSIPAQQIARVVVDCDDLTVDEVDLLSKVVDVEKIKDAYSSYISDPIKSLINEGDSEYLVQHKFTYLMLWAKLGLGHPLKYLEAWIDQTRGYWNGGYTYWRWTTSVKDNDFGIERTVLSQSAEKLMSSYSWLYENTDVLKIFISIGFFFWLAVLIGYVGRMKKRKEIVFLTTPILAIILSLMISTPVYSEFRYAYALFCCIPFLVLIPFYKKKLA